MSTYLFCVVRPYANMLQQSQALLNAIKEYENNKWKVIGQKVSKPAKACEQHAKEHFPGKLEIHRFRLDDG